MHEWFEEHGDCWSGWGDEILTPEEKEFVKEMRDKMIM